MGKQSTKAARRRKLRLQQRAEQPSSAPSRAGARRVYTARKRETQHELSVESYLEGLSYALNYSRDATSTYKPYLIRTYLALRDARVIHVGQETFVAVYQEVDRYTTEVIAGLPYQPPGMEVEVPDDESQRYVNWIIRAAKHQPYPESLPFPAVYLGYGSGCLLQPHTAEMKAPSELRDKIVEARTMGHIMTEAGYVGELLRATVAGPDDKLMQALWIDDMRAPEHGWVRRPDLEPWILPQLIRIIKDHGTFVLETEFSGDIKDTIRHNRKELGIDDYRHMPKPYYRLQLRSHTIREKVRKELRPIPSRTKSYRTDVILHERCRVRRGPLPIDPKLAATLTTRGYKIFTTNALDEKTYERLSRRGMAYKRADEWLAIKVTEIQPFITPSNPNLPYIPAVRTLGKVRTRKPKKGSWTDDPASL